MLTFFSKFWKKKTPVAVQAPDPIPPTIQDVIDSVDRSINSFETSGYLLQDCLVTEFGLIEDKEVKKQFLAQMKNYFDKSHFNLNSFKDELILARDQIQMYQAKVKNASRDRALEAVKNPKEEPKPTSLKVVGKVSK